MKEIDNNLEVEHRYIPNEEMSRSREFHNAIGVVLDTQKDAYFNPVRLENKPQLFVVHQVPKPDGSPLINELDQVQVACNIAFGDHGFCERFTADKPFTVVVISGETDKAIKMQETKEHLELNDTTRELLDSGRIRIVSYT